MFKDAEFMTAKEKELVLKNWKTFLKHGLQKKHFTKRLYQYLHLHSGFIANFNIQGFYSTYFEAGQDTLRFFKYFCNHTGLADYADLHAAMRKVYTQYQDTINKQAEDNISCRINLLDECVKRAKTDLDFAKKFLGKLRFYEGDLSCL